MGHARADPFRFHINRDVDLIKHALTRKRLLAGLGSAGTRQVEFVIARHTSAAFVEFLREIVRRTQPKGREIHVIADNLSTHKTQAVRTDPLELQQSHPSDW